MRLRHGHISRIVPRPQNGSMTILFAGFVIPLMFLLVSAAVEVQTYTVIAERAQAAVDDAALYASRYLPDIRAAERAGRALLTTSLPNVEIKMDVSRDTVGIQALGRYTPSVAAFFETVIGETVAVPYNASARSRSNPFDVFVAVDRSSYLSPELSEDISGAWGSLGTWGAASVFSNLLSITHNGVAIDSTIATQQCFNPTFSLLKRSTIKILDFMSAFSMNRVGISFFPGATRYVGRVREMNAGINSVEAVSFYDKHIDWDSDRYVTVEERETVDLFPVQSVYCASAAEHESYYHEYPPPNHPSFIAEEHSEGNLIDETNWSVNPNYPLSVREVVWSRAVNKNAIMDFELVLSEVEYALFGAGSHDARGGLKNRSTQVAFILTDRVPFAAGQRFENMGDPAADRISTQLDQLRDLKRDEQSTLSIYYIMFGGTQEQTAELESFFASKKLLSDNGKLLFDIRVIRGEDNDAVVTNVLAALMSENRGNVLSK